MYRRPVRVLHAACASGCAMPWAIRARNMGIPTCTDRTSGCHWRPPVAAVRLASIRRRLRSGDVRHVGGAGDDVGTPGLRIDASHRCRADQPRHDAAARPARARTPAEKRFPEMPLVMTCLPGFSLSGKPRSGSLPPTGSMIKRKRKHCSIAGPSRSPFRGLDKPSGATTSLSSASGGPANTRGAVCGPVPACPRPAQALAHISASTTAASAFIA